ncbi:hypothetical protein FEDK69T_08310 [Flavobacterium enshiense DK69]|nr:hypothetical protein FEDK69T_08310 [Flavobacterium enshiense DK69]
MYLKRLFRVKNYVIHNSLFPKYLVGIPVFITERKGSFKKYDYFHRLKFVSK